MTKEQKKHIAILHEAAGILSRNKREDSCCWAIARAAKKRDIGLTKEEGFFASIFKSDSDRKNSAYWWDFEGWPDNPRIFALLFAAEMIRTDSLP